MNKICTDIKQSKKLIELGVDVNTADMIYNTLDIPYVRRDTPIDKYHTPAWSLSALMDILERGALFKTPQGWAYQTYTEYKVITGNYHNNPVDACFETICRLLEK